MSLSLQQQVIPWAAHTLVDEYIAPEPVLANAAPAPVDEYVAPELALAPVVKLATPAPAVAPTPVAESVQVHQVQVVEKTIGIPQWQIIEKIVAFPEEIQTILGTQTFESLGTAPVRQVATAETVEVVELGPPISAEICASCVRDGTRGQSGSCGGGVRPTCSCGRECHSGASSHHHRQSNRRRSSPRRWSRLIPPSRNIFWAPQINE